jgi:hypothetical protein
MSAQVARMRLGGKIEADDQDVQRTALLRRVAVAGAMIAMLIGGLALFDASRKPVEPPPVVSVSSRRLRPLPSPSHRPRKLHCRPPDEAAVEAAPVSLEDTPPSLPESTARPEAPPAQSAPVQVSAVPPGTRACRCPGPCDDCPDAGAGKRRDTACAHSGAGTGRHSRVIACRSASSATRRTPRTCAPDSRRAAFRRNSRCACMSVRSGRGQKPIRHACSCASWGWTVRRPPRSGPRPLAPEKVRNAGQRNALAFRSVQRSKAAPVSADT